jgi:hypothetical protein
MPNTTQSQDSVEKIATDLQLIQERLQKLVWLEQNTTPRITLAKMFFIESMLCNALAEIFLLTSK